MMCAQLNKDYSVAPQFRFTKRTFTPNVTKRDVEPLFESIFNQLDKELELKFKTVKAWGQRKPGGNYLEGACFLPKKFQENLKVIKKKDGAISPHAEAKYFISIDPESEELLAGLEIEHYSGDDAEEYNTNFCWQYFAGEYKRTFYPILVNLKNINFNIYCQIEDQIKNLGHINIEEVKEAFRLDELEALNKMIRLKHEYGVLQFYKSYEKNKVLNNKDIARELVNNVFIPLWKICEKMFNHTLYWAEQNKIYSFKNKMGDIHPLFHKIDLEIDREIEKKSIKKFEAEEGERIKREIISRKRNSELIKIKKQPSDYKCEVCGFNFEKKYGKIGRGYIIAHHKKPLGSKTKKSKTSLKDIALLCSNCHDMIHRTEPPLTINALKRRLTEE